MGRSSRGSSGGGGRSSGGRSSGGRSFGGRSSSSHRSSSSNASSSYSSHYSGRSSRSGVNSSSKMPDYSPTRTEYHRYYDSSRNSYTSHRYRDNTSVWFVNGREASPREDRIASIVFVGMFVFAIIVGLIIFSMAYMKENRDMYTTYKREKMDSSLCNETFYVIDDAGWDVSERVVSKGMKKFYKKTGVQPMIILAEEVDGEIHPSEEKLESYLQSTYDEFINDEGHALFLYLDHGDASFSLYWLIGNNAKFVIDDEACDIIFNLFEYYSNSDLDDSQFVSKVFSVAGDRLMANPNSLKFVPTMCMLGIFVTIGIFIFLNFKFKSREQRLKELELTESILNKDL